MSSTPAPRSVVASLDEIPRFDSEDEERSWWATHELSASVWRDHLGWTDYPFLLALELRAIEAPQVEWLLDAAQRHTEAASRRVRGREPSERLQLQHALASLMFSAAAVESGVNLRLLSPHFRISEDGNQAELATVPSEIDLPWRWKLREAALARESPVDPALLEAIESLCRRRDQLMHAIPPLSEPGPDDVHRSRVYYEAARAFLRALQLPVPRESDD